LSSFVINDRLPILNFRLRKRPPKWFRASCMSALLLVQSITDIFSLSMLDLQKDSGLVRFYCGP
jgi:hypothetical protein